MVYSAVAYWSTENRSFWALTSTNTVTQGIEFQRRQKHYTIVPQKIQNYVTFRYFNRRSSTNIFYMTLKYLIFMFNLQNPLGPIHSLMCVKLMLSRIGRKGRVMGGTLWGDDSVGRGNFWCLQLHAHWLQHPFEWKQKRDRGRQTNETAQAPIIDLS
jgi:hypothetical protein